MPALGRVGTNFIETAPLVVHATVSVQASPAQVWRVLNDTERWPEWFDGLSEARVTSPVWDGVGSTRSVKVGPVTMEEEMVVWEPESHWGFCGIEASWAGAGLKKILETVRISPDGNGSQLRYTTGIELAPFAKPLAGIVKKQMRSAWETALPKIDDQI